MRVTWNRCNIRPAYTTSAVFIRLGLKKQEYALGAKKLHLCFHAAVAGRSIFLTDTQYLFNFLHFLVDVEHISDFVEKIHSDVGIL